MQAGDQHEANTAGPCQAQDSSRRSTFCPHPPEGAARQTTLLRRWCGGCQGPGLQQQSNAGERRAVPLKDSWGKDARPAHQSTKAQLGPSGLCPGGPPHSPSSCPLCILPHLLAGTRSTRQAGEATAGALCHHVFLFHPKNSVHCPSSRAPKRNELPRNNLFLSS